MTKAVQTMYRFALMTAFVSFLLVIAGGLVTSTDSGLSVPDWPLSYGSLFPPMVGGIRFEHTHRMIAAAVGLLTLILTVGLILKEKRVSIRRLTIGAFGLVVAQGILGGITVLWGLPPAVSIAHACLGQTFFAAIVLLAFLLSPSWQTPSAFSFPASVRWLALATTVGLYGQLILGAIVRHTGSFLFFHIGWAVAAAALVIRLRRAVSGEALVEKLAATLVRLLAIQLLLGAATFFTRNSALAAMTSTAGNRLWEMVPLPIAAATSHVAVGALLLATALLLTVRLFHLTSRIRWGHLKAYLELTKPRLTVLALCACAIGYLLGSTSPLGAFHFFMTLAGTALIGGAAGALNQYLEREADAQMHRTQSRPLPSGRVNPENALTFGVLLAVAGLLVLAFAVNPLAGNLGVITLVSYLFIYTPLKRRSAFCTLVGAFPGAMPPLIGWAASHGSLRVEAWFLFGIVFLWQLPHFLAIAWLHQEDYKRAGFQMLPLVDPEGAMTARQIVLYCLALVPVSLLPAACGLAGWLYFIGALVSSLAFLGCGLLTARSRSDQSARQLFLASVTYLTVIFFSLTIDRILL